MKRTLCLALFLLFLAGCIPGRLVDPLPQNRAEAASGIKASYDKFTGTHQCLKYLSRGRGVLAGFMALRKKADTSTEPQIILFVRYTGDDWLFLESLYFLNGKNYPAVSRDTDVGHNGLVVETLGFSVSDPDIKALPDPFEVSVRGSKGSREILFSKAEYEAVRDCSLSAPF